MIDPEPDCDRAVEPWDTLKTRESPDTAASALAKAASATPSLPRRIGPYSLNRILGRGAFGEVWLATREGELARTQLAVKLPRVSNLDLDAIRHEAELWAKVGGHPNILPIFEAAIYDDQVVIVSEYIAEGSLTDWLKAHEGKAPTLSEAVRLVIGVLAGLAHLHKLGVIHRDIKPANILLQNGLPRLADFGLSRAIHSATISGQPAGTPAYMAPEAFDGVRSVQTDLWSVGVVLYQLLTGSFPFPEREWSSLMKSILTREPLPLPSNIPAQYGEIIFRCLAKEPAQRFQSATEMANALDGLVSQLIVATDSVRLLSHLAAFTDSGRWALFVNATNLSEATDREITHVWIEAQPQVYIENTRRPLPKRLKPQESWETWIDVWNLPRELVTENLPSLARARLSTGEIVHGVLNESVPESGWIPGEQDRDTIPTKQFPQVENSDSTKRAWWKFW